MCLYVMSSLRARLIMPASNTHLESFVSVRIAREPDACKLLVSSVYRPPSSDTEFWEQYSAQLDGIFVDSSDLLVLGDLNTDILQPTVHHYHLLKPCAEHQLQNIVHAPTRAQSNTCLDLALLNTTFPLPNPTIIPMSDLTDHHLVRLDIVIPEWKPPATQRTKVVRKPGIATINYSQFNADLNGMLEDSSSFSTLDSQTCHLLTSIAAVTDTHAPSKQVRLPLCPKPKPQPWATPELRKLLQRRSTLHRRVLSQPGNMVLKQQYRSVRREGTLLSRRLKSRFLMHQFSALRRNPRGQWALLNSLSGRRKVRNQPIASLSSLTETFANIVHDLSQPADICLHPATQQSTTAARLSHFRPVTVAHITTLLKATNTSKSPGSDKVVPAVLKNGCDSIAVSLTDIINKSLSTGCVPDIFKNATVSPVFKSGDAESSLRPVSFLPICSKILERVVLEQLIAFFKLHNIMYVPDNQFAYHSNSSCEDCLALVVDEWLKALDNNEYCGIVVADMSKAFDRVKHQELVDELKMLGIADTALLCLQAT